MYLEKQKDKVKDRKLNLQMFAEEGEGGGDTTDKGDVVDEPKEPEKIALTKEELEKKLQSEADKRVTQALETAKAKWEEEYKAKIEQEKEEATRLATLSAEEREKEILKQKEQEILEREQAIKRKELELDAVDILAEKELPVNFKDVLIGEDEESTLDNINTFKEEWDKAIQEEISKRLETPTLSRTASGTRQTKTLGEQLAKLNQGNRKKFKGL